MLTVSRLLPPVACLLLLALATALRAQSVRWDPPGGALAAGQVARLSLVFEGCAPDANVAPPAVPGLEFGQPGRGENSSFSLINGRVTSSRTITLTFPVRPAAGQSAITIPAFEVETDQGRQRVAAASFTVGSATVGNTGVALDTIMRSRLATPDSVWAGEVFPVAYTLEVLDRYPTDISIRPEWKSSPLVTENDFSANNNPEPEITRFTRGGDTYASATYHTRATVKTHGSLSLSPATQIVALRTGQTLGFFGQPVVQQFSVTSQPATLTVKPLPAPAPPGFTGAVGDFRLTAKVVPATAAVGEPVTWTVTLEGTGNWPDLAGLPPREVSRDFRTVSPQAKRTIAEGKLFDATLAEDVVLIPTKPGSYTLGPVTMACFDPKTGQYQTLTTEKFTVTITGSAPAAASTLPPPPGGNNAAAAPALPVPPAALTTPPIPAGLPRDPLPSASPATTPLSARALAVLLLAPFALLPVFWAFLALRRARQTDPLRPQREARARLAATLAEINAALAAPGGLSSAPRANDPLHPSPLSLLLLRWRRDTAALFGVAHAEPTAADLTAGNKNGAATPPSRSRAAELPAPAAKRDEVVAAPANTTPPPLPQETPTPATAHTPGLSWASRGHVLSVQVLPSNVGLAGAPVADWQSLWRDADRALFGARAALPADWPARAEAALAATPLPPFRPLRLFLPRNLFPVVTLLLSSFILHPSSFAADTAASGNPKSEIQNPKSSAAAAAASYRAADFPVAEKSWRSALAAAPTDWAAHHNLSLALAQQSRWPEAAGHALAAFAQRPQDAAVRWQAALALQQAGWIPEATRPFFSAETPGPRAALALRFAPAVWQFAAVLAALLAAAALALLLGRAYAGVTFSNPKSQLPNFIPAASPPSLEIQNPKSKIQIFSLRARWLPPFAAALLVSAVLLGIAAASSLRLYGPLADARAVLVWQPGVLRSIPTEADTEQKTTPLAPGLVALDEGRPFLDWRRLTFPNGQTGWVRQETLVKLW